MSSHLDDGEPLPEDTRAHLDGCAACRTWTDEAHALARRLIAAAPSATAPRAASLSTPRRFWGLRAARLALAWIGVVLIALNLPDLFAPGIDIDIDIEMIHLARHQSAFSMALGVSFLFVAWRPDRAYGLVPIAAVFSVMLAGATVDLLNGASTFERESIHLAEIAGLVIVWVLGINAGPGRRRPDRRLPDIGEAPRNLRRSFDP